MNRKITHEEFVLKLSSIKPFIRCVDGEVYKGSHHKIKFVCSSNHEFESSPTNILNEKYIGCKRCSAQKMSIEKFKDDSKFTEQLSKIHLGYTPISKYAGCFAKVTVVCDKGHKFSSRAKDLLDGTGCSVCRPSGYKDTLPGTLYYLRVEHDNEVFYKIGITNLSVDKRFTLLERNKIKILMQETYENGLLARIAEKQVLEVFGDFLAKDVKIFKKGNTEIFTKDVLCLDSGETTCLSQITPQGQPQIECG